jgi:hypothetical protein
MGGIIMAKGKGGRPSKYESHIKPNLERIPALRKQGYHEEQIAKYFGVAYSTFMEYKKKYPELTDVLKKGKEELIEELEDTLYRKALGKCTVKETKKYIKNLAGGKQETRVEETIKEIPPDTGALVFSLKNLAPDRWKDTHEATFKDLDEMVQILNDIPSISKKDDKDE